MISILASEKPSKNLRLIPSLPNIPNVLMLLVTLCGLLGFGTTQTSIAQGSPEFQYTLSFPDPASNTYHVELRSSGWQEDTVVFKMPRWMPGYYQLMNYGEGVSSLSAHDGSGDPVAVERIDPSTWRLTGTFKNELVINYEVKTERQFVATSYVDSQRAYIIPTNSFLYVEGTLDRPVSVKVADTPSWPDIATGLAPIPGLQRAFRAEDFDILYDSPLLLGNLEELPSFEISGVEHRFIGYKMGDFDQDLFMQQLEKVVAEAVKIIGDVPFDEYTFIGIGPGRGGIEHLNNTTVSFDGSSLQDEESRIRVMNFLSHEYFHHYNAKRIRPFELGPFEYGKQNRTYLLWISEGLTSYFEYLIVKRAGVSDEESLFSSFESHINTLQNNSGRHHQSLAESSYSTWEDGPFGNQGKEENKTISYYQKGPVVGLMLDFAIREATDNEKSLDDVMRHLYWEIYKKEKRGFTGAEFQQICESIAGKSLRDIFEYVYTTKEIDYNTYLNFAGLRLEETGTEGGGKNYKLIKLSDPTPSQEAMFKDWSE